MSFLVARDLRKTYGPVTALADIGLEVEEGEFVTLLGPSGSGKTTLLMAIAGFTRPDSGTILLAGRDITGVEPEDRDFGFVFQGYALFPHMSVADNIAFPLKVRMWDRAKIDARVEEMLGTVGLQELAKRKPRELSGGQQQRVAIARALAFHPKILLLDEPLSALDAPAREGLRGELRHLLESAGVPAIVVTHDRAEALALGDRLAVLADGAVRQVGPVHEVFSSPVDAGVARVVGTENVFPSRLLRREHGLVVVRAGSAELVGVDPGGVEDEAYACIRAEDVVVEPDRGQASSAQNHLPGVVAARRDEGPLVRITIDCGVPLVALVTRASAERLRLVPGASVSAAVKAPSVRVVPRRA
jgi:molybdate transport system ATP-binding protein